MTAPEPDKRPQRAREVVALLAKSRPRDTRSSVLVATSGAPLAPRRMFADVQEPLGTLLRLGVLGFGASGWISMAAIRLSLTLTVYIIAALSFPARKRVTHVGRELDSMLAEGQSGFTDMMRAAMARQR